MARGAFQGSVGGFSGSSESEATVSPGMRYSPSTHRARSSNLHRSVQNGRHAGSTGWLRQYAHTAPATGGISTFYGAAAGGGKRGLMGSDAVKLHDFLNSV